jgi:hypothetical protein
MMDSNIQARIFRGIFCEKEVAQARLDTCKECKNFGKVAPRCCFAN